MIGAIVGLVTVLVVLIMLAFFESRSETKAQCVSQENQEHILRMSLRAVDQAFQGHVTDLFRNWVVDASQQPARAQKGMQNGISAWLRAQEDAKKWLPVIC